MMMWVIGVVLFALAILISVALHECGHMWVARATGIPDRGYGLVCFFDTLHDMGDPVAAARCAAAVLAPGGTVKVR
mgnify:CR=1 FL=1